MTLTSHAGEWYRMVAAQAIRVKGWYKSSDDKKLAFFHWKIHIRLVILNEKYITEINLDIDRVIRIFFSLKYELLYRLGLHGISVCFCSSTLNQSPSVPYRYINILPISSLKFVHYAHDN